MSENPLHYSIHQLDATHTLTRAHARTHTHAHTHTHTSCEARRQDDDAKRRLSGVDA